MSEMLTRLGIASDRLRALRAQITDEMQLRDGLITDAIEVGISSRVVARTAGIDQARVCRIYADQLAARQHAEIAGRLAG